MFTAFFRWFESRLDPYPDQVAAAPPGRFFAFVWGCTRGARGAIVGMTVFTALIGAFEAVLFAMLGRIVRQTRAAVGGAGALWRDHGGLLLLLAAVLIGSTVLVAVQTAIKHQILAGNMPMRLRWNFHRLMLGQSMGFYQDEFAGRVAAKVMQTALAARDVVMVVADILVYVSIYFVTLVAVLGSYDRFLLLPFAVWLAAYFVVLRVFVPRLARVAKQQADARSLMTGRVTDAYTNIATVKLFSHGQREAAYARSAMREFMVSVYGQMRLISGFEIVIHALSMALVVGTVGASLWLWSRGEVGVGAVAAGGAMCLRLTGMSHWIMWEMASLFEHVGTVQDGMGTLATLHTVVDAPDAQPLRVTRGEIRFEQVSFAYGRGQPGGAGVSPVPPAAAAAPGVADSLATPAAPALPVAPPVIDRLDLHIRAGEKIGLVGRSGAGKSTIANLLLRFYDVDSGRVLIDGQDVSRVTQDSLRARIGVVTQDTSLLHRSVRDNILYGRPEADDSAMIAAAQRAEAHEFVQGLGDSKGRRGYDAHVGERGVKLSGGQRQRIAIARVMLKDAPILLLDEATSALDSEVEAAIQQSLYRLMEGKTVVAIAHRLSTIAAMDRLIVLDRGRIVEQGSHAELLSHGGLYARLWAHQSGGFLGDRDEDDDPPGPGQAAARTA